ncbi:MAG: hypothetical protein AAGC60_08790 [Acidobacteriota bacterium]
MGTFHIGKHELHGITVVVDTEGAETYVGRCDDIVDGRVILRDAAVHRDGESAASKQEFLDKAAQWGVFADHKRLVIAETTVASIRRLGEL